MKCVVLCVNQGVRNRRDAVRPTIWLYMLCRQYFIWIKKFCLMWNYRVYLFWIFHIQMEYPYAKHALSYGRANHVSCISLLFLTPWCILDGRVEFIVLYCMTNMMKKQQVRTNLSFLFYSILFTFFLERWVKRRI